MRFYTTHHRFYCGIDLHARTMYVCIMGHEGTILTHRNMPAATQALADALGPYQEDLVLAVECIFTWYWVADLYSRIGVEFVPGHALLQEIGRQIWKGQGALHHRTETRSHRVRHAQKKNAFRCKTVL